VLGTPCEDEDDAVPLTCKGLDAHVQVAARGICQEHPRLADPSQDREVFVAQGLDKDDHRRGELLELVDGKFEVE
jgi:hypothetical protein